MRTNEIKARIMSELEALEGATSSAPETHPARVALAAIRGHIETTPEVDLRHWLDYHKEIRVRDLANTVARAQQAGKSADAVLKPFGGTLAR